MLKVSVVINTCNRAAYLGDTLEGLLQQTYKNFEVVLVNGPSIDNTEEVARRYNIRYFTAPFNISVSRNVGIKHAAGDIIAFIDDDAVPEPNWLEDIVGAYKDKTVAAAGGLVYNREGDGFQACYSAVSRWGYIKHNYEAPYDFNQAEAEYFNVNIGTNASFRRTALIEVGGFDEEIEYYHDESDVCVRLINKGYKVKQLSNAFVHHKMAPSFRRDNKKQFTNWDSTVKNTIYFGLKNSEGVAPLYKRLTVFIPIEINKFVDIFKIFWHHEYTFKEFISRNIGLAKSFYRGYKRGLRSDRKLLTDYQFKPKAFKKFITQSETKETKNIILVSQGFPPSATDGIARYNYTLAKTLANSGHRVFVITKNSKPGTAIKYQDKFWVYFHDPQNFEKQVTGYGRVDNIIALTKSVYNTAKSIHKKTPIDLVVAPLWDVEGLALIEKKIAPVILTLMSPLKKVVETQWYYLDDQSLDIVYELEQYCINNADSIMPISHAIKNTISDLYDIKWDATRAGSNNVVVPLGYDESLVGSPVKKKSGKQVDILYVGRFERRKGIDLLLGAIENIMPKHENVNFHLVGNAKIRDETGEYIYKAFMKKNKNKKWFKRVHQYGYVGDETLAQLYSTADIFVAPSRYESFGLIFIEAMASGVSVIGTNVGGIPEIISDGETGLLFENENTKDLELKLELLITDEKLRNKLSQAAIKSIENKFTAQSMTNKFTALMNKTLESRQLK